MRTLIDIRQDDGAHGASCKHCDRSLDPTKWTKFDWIELEQPKAGPQGRVHPCILKSGVVEWRGLGPGLRFTLSGLPRYRREVKTHTAYFY